MDLNASEHAVEAARISKESYASWRGLAFLDTILRKILMKIKSARDEIEDWYLRIQVPQGITKHLTFYRLHVMYFLLLSILGTLTLYIAHRSDKGERRFTFVDSIFNIVSVVTVTGMMSVRTANLSQFDRILFLILMTLGSPVFTSLIPLCVRRFNFSRHHRKHVKEHMKEFSSSNAQKLEMPRLSVSQSINPAGQHREEPVRRNWAAASTFATAPRFSNKPLFITSPGHSLGHDRRETHRFSLDLTVDIVRAFDRPQLRIDQPDGNEKRARQRDSKTTCAGDVPSYGPVKRPRQETCPSPFNIMRTVEHQALVVLSWLVPAYIVLTQLAGVAINLVLLDFSRYSVELLEERDLHPFFFSVSTVMAAFTNSGVAASDDNLVAFQSETGLLLLYTWVSLMGYLLYPAFLRLIISILYYLASDSRRPIYSYLLNHPRRCFTHLFPHKQSVWLCMTVVGFTVFQLICFCVLEWTGDALEGLNPIDKIVDGLYQSVSARSAGGNVVNIAELSSAILVLYASMMLLAAYPVALLRQNSTEYEYAEIGIYDKRWEERLTDSSIRFQSRKLVANDSFYLSIILFSICVIESKNIDSDPLNYSVFNIIFEIVSAYGGVGLSQGYSCGLRISKSGQQLPPCTDVPYSFSGKWSPLGKLILTTAMFMGRHRGLPHDIDSAIKLPNFSDSSPSASGAFSTCRPQGSRSFGTSPAEPGRFEGDSLDQTSEAGQQQLQRSLGLNSEDHSERSTEEAATGMEGDSAVSTESIPRALQ